MSNSGLASGLSEASGVKLSWAEVSQESPNISRQFWKNRPSKGLFRAY